MASVAREPVGDLSVRELREKCKQLGATVRGSRVELMQRLQKLGLDIRRGTSISSMPRTSQTCPTCGRPFRAKLEKSKPENNLTRRELRAALLNEARDRKRPCWYSPSVERMEDDDSSDWAGVSLDGDQDGRMDTMSEGSRGEVDEEMPPACEDTLPLPLMDVEAEERSSLDEEQDKGGRLDTMSEGRAEHDEERGLASEDIPPPCLLIGEPEESDSSTSDCRHL